MREQRVSERVTRRLHSEIMRALGRMNGIKYYMLFFTLAWVCAPAFAALIAIEQKIARYEVKVCVNKKEAKM